MDKLIELNNDEVFIGPVRIEEDEKMIQNTMLEDAHKRGVNEGLEQGSKEEKINIAKNLISMHLSIDDIIKATGLSKEEIEKLK